MSFNFLKYYFAKYEDFIPDSQLDNQNLFSPAATARDRPPLFREKTTLYSNILNLLSNYTKQIKQVVVVETSCGCGEKL